MIYYYLSDTWIRGKKSECSTSGVTSHYIVLHPVSSRASRITDICVQFIHHSWLVDDRNI